MEGTTLQKKIYTAKKESGDINIFVQKKYYELRKKELRSLIEKYTKTIAKTDFSNLMKKYTEDSMILFKAYLAKRFNKVKSSFAPNALKSNSAKFIERYPIIFSTSHSLRNCLNDDFIYDYLIVDEASQTDIVTGALAMSCAKNVVIVGDTKQLSNIVPSKHRTEFEKIFSSYKLPPAYNYCRYNLMTSVLAVFPELRMSATLLSEHYRCHPKIIGFCNERYYNGELVSMTRDEDEPNVMIAYKTAERTALMQTDINGKKYNPRQVDVIKYELLQKYSIDIDTDSVAIIAPYRRQVTELNDRIGEINNTEIDTIHKFQGREKGTVIFSTVEDKITNEFINESMVNVAVSRAVKQFFIIIPNDEDNITNTNIKDLVRYIRYNNMEVVESNIVSIFDLFHRQYSKRLTEYEKAYKKLGKDIHIAENLVKTVLDELLEMEVFSGLGYARNYPLATLLKDDLMSMNTLFNTREKEFAANTLSHSDFLIYNNSDKSPVLAIEVDGGYHRNDLKQMERDAVKDSIFSKINIPLLRLSTTGSMEKQRIYEELCAIRNIEPDPEYDEVV